MRSDLPLPDLLPGIPRTPLAYPVYRDEIAEDGDLLLWEPATWYGRVLATATGGPFSHVSAAVWLENRLLQAGFEEHKGGVLTFLSEEVHRTPGRISVFRVEQSRGLAGVRRRLIDDLRGDYEWSSIRLLAFGHLLGIRWLTRQEWYRRRVREASLQTAGAHCAKHIARSFATGAGVSFVRKEFAETTPNDIGMSGVVRYLGTLVGGEASGSRLQAIGTKTSGCA